MSAVWFFFLMQVIIIEPSINLTLPYKSTPCLFCVGYNLVINHLHRIDLQLEHVENEEYIIYDRFLMIT